MEGAENEKVRTEGRRGKWLTRYRLSRLELNITAQHRRLGFKNHNTLVTCARTARGHNGEKRCCYGTGRFVRCCLGG